MRRYGATGSVTRSRMEDCNSSMHKTMPTLMLDKAERKALAAQAHPLNPVVLLGAAGLTPAVLQEIDRALRAHELIKVRLAGMDREARQAAMDEITDSTSSAAVQLVGNVLVLFRPKPEEDTGI